MMTFDIPSELTESRGFLSSLFDAIPCGVIVVDGQRRIVAANRIFEDAVGLQPGTAAGSCEGKAIGCINASEANNHRHSTVDQPCEACDARIIALKALETGDNQRGRAHFQIEAGGRVEDVTLTLRAAPFTCRDNQFAIVIVEDLFRLRGLQRPTEKSATLGMIGSDPQMVELFDTIRQVGPLDVPVLIQGESGTGKELVANALHAESRRNDGLLVPVNCGALPDGLLESELFGHVKGAFTGAVRTKRGRFQLADGGTIFLDEIGELSPQMQVKFLRVLQNGTFERVGGESTVAVNARVICATNRDLESEVEAGRFRADLFYRLCVVPITVPALRTRKDDILELANFFLKRVTNSSAQSHSDITDEAIQCLMEHRWPGNVRELENAMRYSAIKSQGLPIRTRHLPPQVQKGRSNKTQLPRRRKLDQKLVRKALKATSGNKSEAARHLGVSRATLYRFLSENTLAV